MIEKGIVTLIKDNLVEIDVTPVGSCSECGMCASGKDGSSKKLSLPVPHSDLNIGDLVEVSIHELFTIGVSFTVYMMPLIAMIAGYGAGYMLNKVTGSTGSLLPVSVSFGALAASIFSLKIIDRFIKNYLQRSVIIKKLSD